MKCTIPEISWHNRDPVLSIDIQPLENEDFYRLASGGADCHLLIWHLKVQETGAVKVDIVSDLTRHQKAINVVRWSPTGQLLASGDDDANIIIWNLKTDNIPLLEGESNDKEIWLVNKILRGHKEDVYDICWSPNGLKLLSGSIDNTAIIWDMTKGQTDNILTDHKGFVQGVTWDPKGQYLATLSSDRVCRVFDNTGKSVKSRTHKGVLPVPESHSLYNKEIKYFHDDTFKSYFRRLSFSCDGSLLFVPSGCIDIDTDKILYTTYVFTLDKLTTPVAILPSPKQITIATRCCPVLFKLQNDGPAPAINLPYRMVLAVATDRDVFLYDTQQLIPIAHFHRIHYTRITDLTWSHDGQLLLASSTDGFCTIITFEKDELGNEYIKEESEVEDVVNLSSSEQENAKVVKKPNMLVQWTLKSPDRFVQGTERKQTSECSTKIPVTLNESIENKATPIAVRREPKRVALIKIGEINKPKVTSNDSTNDLNGKPMTTLDTITITNELEKVVDDESHTVLICDDTSPVKSQTSHSFDTQTNSNNCIVDEFQTPKNKRANSISKKNSTKRSDTKRELLINSPLFKFLQKTPVKPTKETASLNNTQDASNEETSENVTSGNLLPNPDNNVIMIEDSSDDEESSEPNNIPEQNTDNSAVPTSTEKENIDLLHVDTVTSIIDSDKNSVNAVSNTNNQSPSSKVLVKPTRRIQLVTLSSPKRKKHD